MDENQASAVETALKEGSELLTQYAFSFVGAIVLLIVGFIFAGLMGRWARSAFDKVDTIDATLGTFLSNIVRYLIIILVVVAVLAQFGVQTTSIIAALGAAGLAIGLALQGTLANIASGIMLLVLRPFNVGEYIQAGSISGTIVEIGLFTTELRQPDGLFVMAPNSKLSNESIINYSRHSTRRFDLTIGIGYDDDMKAARAELLDLAQAEPRVLAAPEPVAFVANLGDSAVSITLRLWINSQDYMNTTWDLTERAKNRFDDVGISIPYPQREVTQRIVEAPKKKKR